MCLINNYKYIFNVNQVQISYASVFAHVDIVSPLTFQKAINFMVGIFQNQRCEHVASIKNKLSEINRI